MSLSRRGFLGWLGASTAAASTVALAAPPPSPNTLVLTADLGGGMMSFELEEPPTVIINREEYFAYAWDHVLGFLTGPEVLIHDTGEWGEWWKDKVCYDQRNKEVLIPKIYKDELPFWQFPNDRGRRSFLKRWHHMKAVQNDLYIGGGDLDGAVFSNPKLYALAHRWRRKHDTA